MNKPAQKERANSAARVGEIETPGGRLQLGEGTSLENIVLSEMSQAQKDK